MTIQYFSNKKTIISDAGATVMFDIIEPETTLVLKPVIGVEITIIEFDTHVSVFYNSKHVESFGRDWKQAEVFARGMAKGFECKAKYG